MTQTDQHRLQRELDEARAELDEADLFFRRLRAERDDALALAGRLREVLKLARDALSNCHTDGRSHYCPNCARTIDRNSVVRNAIDACLAAEELK